MIFLFFFLYPCKTNACLSVHVSVCVQNTSFFCICTYNDHILKVCRLNFDLLLVEELSPLELRLFFFNCQFPSKGWEGGKIKSHSLKASVFFSSPEHNMLRVSYYDRSMSGIRPCVCPSVNNYLKNLPL